MHYLSSVRCGSALWCRFRPCIQQNTILNSATLRIHNRAVPQLQQLCTKSEATDDKKQPSTALRWLLEASGFYSKESMLARGAEDALSSCMAQARRSEWTQNLGVEASYHAQFQLEGLHLWMFVARARVEEPEAAAILMDKIFEMWWHSCTLDMKAKGLNFLKISASLKQLQLGFRGSAKLWDAAIEDDFESLHNALRSTLYFNSTHKEAYIQHTSKYVKEQLYLFRTIERDAILEGKLVWVDLPRPKLIGGEATGLDGTVVASIPQVASTDPGSVEGQHSEGDIRAHPSTA